MANYIVNWALSGFRGAEHASGAIITAAENEAEEIAVLVKAGVLTAVEKAEVALHLETPEKLVAYAKEKFGFDLDPSLSKDAMLAEIASLEAGQGSSEESTGAPTDLSSKTKAELIEFAKVNFNFTLKPNLSKDAMLAEIASLEAKKQS